MISISHPEILQSLRDFDYGLMPVYVPDKDQFMLIIKASKETLLTARINNEFQIYLIDDLTGRQSHLGLISAFFDDHDEPLVLLTPLFAKDEMLKDVSSLLSQSEFELYFFDEHNREFMGVKALNKDSERFRTEIDAATFCQFVHSEILTVIKRLQDRFSIRDAGDDANAYTITLGERLYPDDVVIMDLRENFHGFNDSERSIAATSLERDGDPGPMQERDIALMMKRLFDEQCLYLNPFRVDTERELTDILVVTDRTMLFIQAKDSPNTGDILRRSMDRKRKTIRSHIQKASNQLRGALTYARDNGGITIKISDEIITIPIAGRQMVGLIIVHEMFDDDYAACSAPVLEVVRSLELPIALLDYQQLHVLTQNLKTPARFVNAIYRILDVALENEQFPKSVWSGLPSDKSD